MATPAARRTPSQYGLRVTVRCAEEDGVSQRVFIAGSDKLCAWVRIKLESDDACEYIAPDTAFIFSRMEYTSQWKLAIPRGGGGNVYLVDECGQTVRVLEPGAQAVRVEDGLRLRLLDPDILFDDWSGSKIPSCCEYQVTLCRKAMRIKPPRLTAPFLKSSRPETRPSPEVIARCYDRIDRYIAEANKARDNVKSEPMWREVAERDHVWG